MKRYPGHDAFLALRLYLFFFNFFQGAQSYLVHNRLKCDQIVLENV